MQPKQLERGSIVQLNPESVGNKMFAGCLMVVFKCKNFGVDGYVQALGRDGKSGGGAYYRATWEEMEETGGSVIWGLK